MSPLLSPIKIETCSLFNLKKKYFKAKRHRFIITSQGEGNSLVGIYFHNYRTYTLWAELWSEEKLFAFFDTSNGQVSRGNCR